MSDQTRRKALLTGVLGLFASEPAGQWVITPRPSSPMRDPALTRPAPKRKRKKRKRRKMAKESRRRNR